MEEEEESSARCSTATSCEHILRDVIEYSILLRLPVKSLFRNRIVRKSWKNLISDPHFAKRHFSLSPKINHILLRRTDQFIFYDSAVSNPTTTATRLRYRTDIVVGSCDGILCFSTSFTDSPDTLLLWNPSIGKFKLILSFDDQNDGTTPTYGFGRDHLSDTYKLVALYFQIVGDEFNPDTDKTQVRVHILGTGSWRRIQDFPLRFLIDDGSYFVSGRLHWIAADLASTVIVSLDLGNESFQEISLPNNDELGTEFRHGRLAVLRDCLCLLECCEFVENCLGDLWIMKEYGNADSWTKLFRIQFHVPTTISYSNAKLLYISEDDQVIMTLSSMVVVYNSRNGIFKHIYIKDCSLAHPYVESLISPSWY